MHTCQPSGDPDTDWLSAYQSVPVVVDWTTRVNVRWHQDACGRDAPPRAMRAAAWPSSARASQARRSTRRGRVPQCGARAGCAAPCPCRVAQRQQLHARPGVRSAEKSHARVHVRRKGPLHPGYPKTQCHLHKEVDQIAVQPIPPYFNRHYYTNACSDSMHVISSHTHLIPALGVV